ncbi:MAG: cytoplasmic protein, partial [Thermodesulfobacteriota bacterium]|nr:cytoplasmic protein [Thermodesulfobacteriota bacterium]
MKKVVMFAFNGELMCFVHVLLNAIDMNEKGNEVKIVIEGSATKLVQELAKEESPMHRLYEKAKGLDLMDGACKACSNKMGAL